MQNIFAKISYNRFLLTSMKTKFVIKKIDQIFKKINTDFPLYIEKWALFAWLINFATGNLLCDQIIMYQKNFSENKNHDVNENFKVTIKFGVYIFLRWYLKRRNIININIHDLKVKSLKQQSTLGLLQKTGPWP